MKAAPARAMRLDVFSRFSRPFEMGQYGVSFFTAGLLALLILIVGVPVLMVVLMSLRTGFPGEGGPLTLQNFFDVYADAGTYAVLGNTLLFALGSVAVALLFAIPLSWLLMRTDIPFKKTFYVLLTVGILIPVFLRTIAWILLLSPRIGLLNQVADADFRSGRAAFEPLHHYWNGFYPGSLLRSGRVFHAFRSIPHDGSLPGRGSLYLGGR